jgi:hypothetical protein
MTVRNETRERRSMHVMRKTVILEPGASVEVKKMTESELVYAQRQGLTFDGSVDLCFYKNFKVIVDIGVKTFGEVKVPKGTFEIDLTVSEEEAVKALADEAAKPGEAGPVEISEETEAAVDAAVEGEETEDFQAVYEGLMSDEYSYPELKAMAKKLGLSAAGSRSTLAKRIAGIPEDAE